ncbi:MAG: GNAT family N-acetyltransferase [Actinomycetota bacterium]|nr:GNAT family N-acetyltransferase [Actinomycetota bacterium]
MTQLAALLEQVGRDHPPPADGGISFFPGPTGTPVAAVFGFTGHHVIAADADPDWLTSQFSDCEMTRPLKPDFLAALAGQLDARPGGQDALGRGLAGRWEISLEVEEVRRGAGLGRRLAAYGRALLPAKALLWAQVHPANVASMRAFLAAGYRPVGAEVLFTGARSGVQR